MIATKIFGTAAADLRCWRKTRSLEMTVSVGQAAPDFSLKSHDGRTIHLRDFQGKQHVVLVFFPLAWTPV
jgi:peroxiredoxin